MHPLISGELNKLVNYIDIPESTGTRQSGKNIQYLELEQKPPSD